MVIIGATVSKDLRCRMVGKCAKVILTFKTFLYPMNLSGFKQIEIVHDCVISVSEISLLRGSLWFFSHI